MRTTWCVVCGMSIFLLAVGLEILLLPVRHRPFLLNLCDPASRLYRGVMTTSLPTGVALAVLLRVAYTGALTAAAVVRRHGPRPAWHGLVASELLRPLRTLRGEVLVLSPRGHALLEAHGYGLYDRVTGVERAVDRSYQNDALAVLQAEGYRVVHAHRQGGPLGHGRIVRYTLEVPPAQLVPLEDNWPGSPPPLPGAAFREALGRPSLYATCSRGGRGRKAIQDLVECVHAHDIDTWRAPLLVVVPAMSPDLRAYLRRYTAQRTTSLDRQFGPGRLHGGRPRYEALEVRVLPP